MKPLEGWTRDESASLDPVDLAAQMAEAIAPMAERYDRENRFAEESIRLLQRSGYAALTVPVEFGGRGAGLLALVRAQERLAQGDAAVALAVGMSLLKLAQQAARPSWPRPVWERVMRAAGERGALTNALGTEPNLGSPSRGGKPETMAVPEAGGGWRISGHKTWSSLAPILDFFEITATIQDGSDDVGRFMLERGEGIRIVETWDSMGMRATGSHDVLFEGAWAAPDSLLTRSGGGGEADSPARRGVAETNPYFALPVAAVYLGIAAETQRATVRYAQGRVPLALGKPLTEVETIRASLADNELDLRAARRLVLDCAARVEACAGPFDDELKLDVYVAKSVAANHAIAIVDRAMRVVGGAALARGSVWDRAYRNVRAGLLNPPADDLTRRVLGAWTVAANGEG